MTAVTRELAEFAAGISFEALPAEVRERVKALALDLVGIAVRARNEAESTGPMVGAAARLGMTGGACTVIGDAVGPVRTVASALQREQSSVHSAIEAAATALAELAAATADQTAKTAESQAAIQARQGAAL